MTSGTEQKFSSAYLRRRKSQSGQSVLIALAVLFLLGFLGALFSIIVVRNLANSQAHNDTLTTDYFAQAGINYANSELETSAAGADWRPPLQYQWTTGVIPSYLSSQSTTSAYGALKAANVQDPDNQWLTQGFTRYNMNGGRFLIRLTYDPSLAASSTPSPTAKYIRIESVGRLGTIDDNDPTTFTNTPPDFRRSELVAYKPIGIVDYSRFITNKDNRTDTATLGMPSVLPSGANSVVTPGVIDIPVGSTQPTEYPLITTYGSPNAYNSLVPTGTSGGMTAFGGGSLRSNMNLRLYGINNVYLNTVLGDDWEVAGNITLDQYAVPTTTSPYDREVAQCEVYAPPAGSTAINTTLPTSANDLFPSNDTMNGFNTFGGAVRDGNTTADSSGYPRSIRRLNPPLIDSLDAATGLTRYQTLIGYQAPASNAVVPEMQPQQWSNLAADFQPATVYISNQSDIQSESANVVGGSSLRETWLNPSSPGWEAGFYSPPGATITFGQVPAAQKSTDINAPYGITIARNDGLNFASGGSSLYLSYESAPSPATLNPSSGGVGYLDVEEPGPPTNPVTPANDVVIYASGNVRVRGLISNPDGLAKHITIVTNGIAYIDGSILKGNPQSSIAILARQYVCVNTTQFLAGAIDSSSTPSMLAADAQYLTFTGSDTVLEDALYGPAPIGTTPTYALYVTQSTGNLGAVSGGDVFSPGNPLLSFPELTVNGSSQTNNVYSLTTAPPLSTPFQLSFTKDPTAQGDWILEKAAILPADIDIQAVLYAQDDSFFVIPGTWFNFDSSDNITNYINNHGTRSAATQNSDFPFYGQPIDMQITIDGAVSENIPADISDQTAWNQKWGWIPRYHGSDFTNPSPHAPAATAPGVGVGLNITYDYSAGFPYSAATTTSSGAYLRQDRFGRPLPFAPALPVSPDLLYSGQPPT